MCLPSFVFVFFANTICAKKNLNRVYFSSCRHYLFERKMIIQQKDNCWEMRLALAATTATKQLLS